jgi:aspartate-semialdehyde dehydrogenase
MPKARVAILGASGLVSQRMQQRLSNHPWFEIVAVAGQSTGTYLRNIPWHLDQHRPRFIDESDIFVKDINSKRLAEELLLDDVEIVFSALPTEPALRIERSLVEAGIHVFSNASAYRMSPDVPLVVVDVNPDSLVRPSPNNGMHACATNCTLIPVLHPLSLLHQRFEIDKIVVRSQQALSGAGWKLLHNSEKKANAIENEIDGEAEKIIEEAEKILNLSGISWDVQCKRVDEQDGHMVDVEVHLNELPTSSSVVSTLSASQVHKPLPSQPECSMQLINTEPNRNQHLWNGQTMSEVLPSVDLTAGMTTTVQLRSVQDGIVVFRALSHNTIRGAAGGVVLLAELAVFNNMLPSVGINPSSSSSES